MSAIPLPARHRPGLRPAMLGLALAALAVTVGVDALGGGHGVPWGRLLARLATDMLLPLAGFGAALGAMGEGGFAPGLGALAAGAAAGLAWRHAFLEAMASLPNVASHAFLVGPIAGVAAGLLLLAPRALRPLLLGPAALAVGAMLAVAVKLADPSLRDPHVPWIAGLAGLSSMLAAACLVGAVRHRARDVALRILGSWVLAIACLTGGATLATRGAALPPPPPSLPGARFDETLFPEFGRAP
ncbi:hypothetical protein [Aureimonas pseudogalii]|uniref:hypothetical protein n=1 Tax=Aureimonas pseudogalii TaxID=1744844 RepID=UPI0035E9C182